MNRLVVVLSVLLAVLAVSPAGASAHYLAGNPAHSCRHAELPLAPRSVTIKGRRADREQRRIVTQAVVLARRAHAPWSVQVAILAALTPESGARNLPYGHASSVGVLQLLDIHEPDRVGMDWRMVPANSLGWFLRGAMRLSNVRGRSPSDIAYAIERPAVNTYGLYVPEARRNWRRIMRVCV